MSRLYKSLVDPRVRYGCAALPSPPPPPDSTYLISYSFRQNIAKTRMHSRMCTVCSSGHLSCHAHTSCHTCASIMNSPLPHTPLPATHKPPVTPATHPGWPLPRMPPNHAHPHHTHTLPCMPLCHACPPCHACRPGDRRNDTRLLKNYLSATTVAYGKYLASNQFLVSASCLGNPLSATAREAESQKDIRLIRFLMLNS